MFASQIGPCHVVLDRDPAPTEGDAAAPPQLSAHVYCGQTSGWIGMPLGTKVGLGPGDIVLDGDPAPSYGKRQKLLSFCYLFALLALARLSSEVEHKRIR